MTSSWRTALVVSVVVHVAIVSVLLLSPSPPGSGESTPLRVARNQTEAPQTATGRVPAVVPQPVPARATDGASRGAWRGSAPDKSGSRLALIEIEIAHVSAGDPLVRATMEFAGNHLWQSTLCLAVAALLTLALRRQSARLRHAIWVAASAKFLVPFAPVMALGAVGRQFGWRPMAGTRPADIAVLMDTISQPFSRSAAAIGSTALLAARPVDPVAMLPLLLLVIWAIGSIAILLAWSSAWRRLANIVRRAPLMCDGAEFAILRRLERRAGIATPTTLVASTTSLEPGVFGLKKPVLLWPRGMSERLTAGQIETLLAHEVCHIRRRDNLLAAVHMVVEALFWFHPLVWWLETRLIAERERACDEGVVRLGHDPVVYAEGILKTCQFYAETPLACVSGVTGSDLKRRIEVIMKNQAKEPLGRWRRLLVVAVGIAIVVAPVVAGALNAPLLRAQAQAGAPGTASAGSAFETASVKPNNSGDPRSMLVPQPGGRLNASNVSAGELVRFAYNRPDFQVFGGPDWLKSDRFDLVAKAEGDPSVDQKRLMLRTLLAERFKLTVHTETRDLPFYALVMARSDGRMGRQLRRTEADCTRASDFSGPGIGPAPTGPAGPPSCGFFGFAPGTDFRAGRGGVAFRGLTMPALAKIFVPMVRRSVLDQTGLAGYFDADFDFIAELPLPPPPPGVPPPQFDAPFVSIFTVLPEQLGLKLDSRRGPVDVLVIDSVARPNPD